ncbi:MAG TPA: protein TolR [Xanthomonadaceae bacterium]|jgi:biopolymer transport protein TolR|nr:protein TolR [Xanthomonadaceae bacterium]
MAAFGNRHKKRKLKNEINVVPYVDVMLVLLVIFMITSSVMNLGVEVNLPDSDARSVEPTQDPVVVSVSAGGQYSITLGDGADQPVSAEELGARIAAFVQTNPDTPVFVAADGALPYQTVMDTMALLQGAGVTRAALMSEPRAAER